MLQFKRRANVVIQSQENYLVIEGLRIVFNVVKSLTSTYNKTEIEIYNLSKTSRDKIDDKDKKFFLNAGYDEPGQILPRVGQGDVTLFKHCFEPPNVVTKIETSDGLLVGEKQLSFSSKENIKFFDALKKICKDVKAEIDFKGITVNELKNKVMSTGYAFTGKLKDAMDELSDSIDSDWYIEDDQLKIITRGQNIAGTVPLIDETTGMIGIPEKFDDINTKTGKQKKKNAGNKSVAMGYSVTTLLNPTILPGYVVRVKSNKMEIDNECIVHDITHRGDTHGHEWFSTMKVAIK
jgi:hypothetical protein